MGAVARRRGRAFTLVETMAAVLILAFICTSVLVVFDRSVTSAVDSVQRMRAFEIARENMEKLLACDSVEAMAEYGMSDKYTDIQWQTTVESFYEPLTSRTWVQAVCSAEYTDSSGELQSVELTHWLTGLTEKQAEQMEQFEQQADANAPADDVNNMEPLKPLPPECEGLPFCERVQCLINADALESLNPADLMRYFTECVGNETNN